MSDIRIPIGLCSIKVGAEDLAHQGDAAVFTAEPQYIDIDLYDLPKYDKILDGWDVRLTVTLDEESYEAIMQSLSASEAELHHVMNDVIGVKDGKLHQRMRNKAKEIVIHPNDLPENDDSFDITIFKAIAVSGYQRTYGKEQSKWEVTFEGLSRTGDPTQAGNYFHIGQFREEE